MNLSTRSVLKTTVVCSLWSYTKKTYLIPSTTTKRNHHHLCINIYMPATNIHILTNIHPFRFNDTHTELFQTAMIQQQVVWNDEQNVYILLLLTHPRAISSSPYIREKKFNKMCESLLHNLVWKSLNIWMKFYRFKQVTSIPVSHLKLLHGSELEYGA